MRSGIGTLHIVEPDSRQPMYLLDYSHPRILIALTTETLLLMGNGRSRYVDLCSFGIRASMERPIYTVARSLRLQKRSRAVVEEPSDNEDNDNDMGMVSTSRACVLLFKVFSYLFRCIAATGDALSARHQACGTTLHGHASILSTWRFHDGCWQRHGIHEHGVAHAS